MINVTTPFLPEQKEYFSYLEKIWNSKWLTNNGPLLNELELQLKMYLGVEHMLFVGNGTLALQIAYKGLQLTGEVITTPFSYVATTSSLAWEGLTPVFADICEDSWNIDPDRIEQLITPNTSAIVATHVFGNPCEVERLQEIATQHNLSLIYDAAHGFGTTWKGKSVFAFGDASTVSFHATKLFHTIEGGGIFAAQPELLRKFHLLRNFGHNGPEQFEGVGINGKNSEFHAAMGLANLPHVGEILERRKEQYLYYLEKLQKLKVQFQVIHPDAGYNYAYFPVVFEHEEMLLKSKEALERNRIFPRRYFYPLLSTLDYVQPAPSTPVAASIAKRILCLPVFHELTEEMIDMIARILLRTQRYG